MKTRFQLGLFALALLMAGCGGNKGGEPAADRPIIQMDSIDYPDLPDGATIRMSKSDFPMGKIRSIEQIPIEGLEITNRELALFSTKDYLLVTFLSHTLSSGKALTCCMSSPRRIIGSWRNWRPLARDRMSFIPCS